MLLRIWCLRYHSPYRFLLIAPVFGRVTCAKLLNCACTLGSYYHLSKEELKTLNGAGAEILPVRGSGGHPASLQKCLLCAFDLSKRGNVFTAKFLSFLHQAERLFQMIIIWDDQATFPLTNGTGVAVLPWQWFSEGLKSRIFIPWMWGTWLTLAGLRMPLEISMSTTFLDELSAVPWGCSCRLILLLESRLRQLGHRGSETQSKV